MGANYYLPKPFTEELLLQAVQKMLPTFVPFTMKTQTPPSIYLPTSTFIPYRQDEIDIMLQDNPFARASIITDGQLLRLYALIDGERTIQDLSEMLQLDLQSTLKLLKTLWKLHYIVFYDAKKHPLQDISIFNNIES